MSSAVTSLIALLVAIALSFTSRVNVGVVAIALAWVIGVYQASLSAETVASAFPVGLFVTLAGVTLLFAIAETNGTLERLTHRATTLARGSRRILPIMFFVLAGAISSVGPGAIAAVALVAPMAMTIGARAGVPAFLTALMVANGANAGNLSPVSAVGVIANTKMADAGLTGHALQTWAANFIAHVLVGAAAYFLFSRQGAAPAGAAGIHAAEPAGGAPAPPHDAALALGWRGTTTAVVIGAWIAAVLFFKVHVGLAAFAAAALLIVARAGDEASAVRRMPWGVMLMVCGISVLIGVLEKSGGMDLFTSLLARLATPATVNGAIAFVTGLISTWSSTSGVVLPAFLPTVPDLVAKVGGGDPLAVALSINVGSSLVDVSPLSTLGALCVAAVAAPRDADRLFRQLMTWGLSMAVVGAVICQLFAGAFARL